MKTPSLSLMCINIEGHRHLGRVLEFVKKHAPDVLCLQEVFEDDLPRFAEGAGMEYQFASMGGEKPEGLAMLWRGVSLLGARTDHYYEHLEGTVGWGDKHPNSCHRILLTGMFRAHGARFRIGTTHFTWTPNGSTSNAQQRDVAALLKVLEKYRDEDGIVFCGDFNAPRGREIFDTIAKKYQDNIPPNVSTTLDQTLHRAAPIFLVVDGLFSSPEYQVTEAAVVQGVSDHCAVLARVFRN